MRLVEDCKVSSNSACGKIWMEVIDEKWDEGNFDWQFNQACISIMLIPQQHITTSAKTSFSKWSKQSTKHLLLLNRPDRVTLAIHNVWRKPKHWNILQLSLQSRTIYFFSKQNWNWKENSYGKYTESIINLKKVQ